MCDPIIYVLLGLAVGYIGGFAGIGGGPFLVSFLVLYCGMSQLVAQGNVLTMMLGPMSLLGVLSMYEYVKKQWLNIAIGVIAYCICSYFGAVFAFYIGETDLKYYFAVLLVIIALMQFRSYLRKNAKASDKEFISPYWILILAAFTGILGGMFGIGAGVLMVPILIGIFKLKKEYARSLSLAILIPPVSYGAFIKYNFENPVDWQLVGILFGTYFISNFFGAKMGSKISGKAFTLVYGVILLSIAVIYLV
ncbi:sulfite exporter TauE/SafE family protein [Kordia sp. YSTF-M3]|uniref:Probable membrane transporter protein n=1 Tax=Kordia aestuariivivens TaxID=2759037 RepID=A0ABR7QCE4_9FLAO|nr:sulfite exporter TauE/SafE family protein [Kordia aestuariivivens]MBC8756219.1 sulfite exporter TauE/SafE family protein [Kordia aestuariivivens]